MAAVVRHRPGGVDVGARDVAAVVGGDDVADGATRSGEVLLVEIGDDLALQLEAPGFQSLECRPQSCRGRHGSFSS